jgi:hypothetical protein
MNLEGQIFSKMATTTQQAPPKTQVHILDVETVDKIQKGSNNNILQ